MNDLIERLEGAANLPAISLWQPWASLWCSPIKRHETRHWATVHRGWLAVHAAKRRIDDLSDTRLDELLDSEFGHHWGLDLPRGGIVGLVNVIACKPTSGMTFDTDDERDDYECGDFHPGRFAWERDQFIRFDDAIPYRGAQGFFPVPTAPIIAALKARQSVSHTSPDRETT